MLSPNFKPTSLPVLTLAEQVVAAELAYYRQLEQCVVMEADLRAWNHKQALNQALQVPLEDWASPAFTRHVLERHHRSLHNYMARHLNAEAWRHWFLHGGLVASFR